MTIPQIDAVRMRIGKHICVKAGVPPSEEEKNSEPEEEHTVDQALQFVAQFSTKG